MLLRRLVLVGFKTFASRTTFEFDGGTTAVIGPNGSGKSNLADAVRWVLGETSHAAVRSKRVEDVIFAGGSGRPALGMAEVSLTLDNSGRLLDTDFAEVTITRRAFRDGESHYLINGNRVRLKDIVELTAPLGGSYTVVGQGLVDVALSQRPEERRGLFEHAAGISGLQMKRHEAERRLAAAEANCQRLDDILAELSPRLRQLERQARQAAEAGEVSRTLQDALQRWYARLAHDLGGEVAAREAAALAVQERLEADRQQVASLEERRQVARQALAAAREALERHRARQTALAAEVAGLARAEAVAAERRAAVLRRLADDRAARAGLAERRQGLEAQLEATEQEQSTLAEAVAEAQARARSQGEAEQQADQAWRQAETAVTAVRQEVARLAAQAADQETRLARLHERRAAIERELEQAAADGTDRAARRDDSLARQGELQSAIAAADGQLNEHDHGLTEADARLRAAEEAVQRETAQLAALDRDLTTVRTRLEALSRLKESGAGLAAGPKAVLEAASLNRLPGIVGTVSGLIVAPANLETAIEVALGGHLQDVVVERWADAEQAIDALKRGNLGRATFQPLDTVRPGRPLAAEREAGVVGVAADLVEYEPRLDSVVRGLLGRVLVVADLAASRRLVGRAVGWTLVTLAGELVRPGGSVTGGSAVREAGVLARERELRAGPPRIKELESQRQELVTAAAARAEERQALVEERRARERDRLEAVRQRDRLTHALAHLTTELAALDKAMATADQQAADRRNRLASLDDEMQRATVASTGARGALDERQFALSRLAASLPALHEQRAVVAHEASAARADAARLDERRQAKAARVADLRQQLARLTAEEQGATHRQADLTREQTAADREHAQAVARHQAAVADLTRAEAEAAPALDAVQAATTTAEALEADWTAAQTALVTRQAEAGRCAVAVEHAQGELAALRGRLEADLPDVLLESLALPMTEDPRLEATIAALREHLRRIGLVDPAVVEEYEAARDRHAFLSREMDDVASAARALRGAIGELDGQMRERFSETFAAVNDAFGRAFARLFSGGSARLVLGDDPANPGVDILAQPPGKRLQSLTLLSGGERALTAAALLFAILEVNPSPFVLLDEVDAALDETNVVRFRGLLQDRAAQTQFVVVTHNRGTIEGANTLYGISMGQDGVSQVISLRLAGDTARVVPAVSA